jgi:hypothetical protein
MASAAATAAAAEQIERLSRFGYVPVFMPFPLADSWHR